jgi:hypothetical protein
MRPLSILVLPFLLAALTVPARAAGSTDWKDPSYQELESAGGEPVRSPWEDIQGNYSQWEGKDWESPENSWESLDSEKQTDLLRKAYGLYVKDLAKMEGAGEQDRKIYDTVTPEQVIKVKKIFGDQAARDFADVRSRLIVREYDTKGTMVNGDDPGLRWLDVFDKADADRIRKDIAKRQAHADKSAAQTEDGIGKTASQFGDKGRLSAGLASESGFRNAADGSVNRAELPESAAVVAPAQAARAKPSASQDQAPGDGRPRLVSVKSFSDAPPSPKVSDDQPAWKTQGKSLDQIDQERRNGVADMVLGGAAVAGGAVLISWGMPYFGGALIVGGAGLAVYGYNQYQDNNLTDEQRQSLQPRSRY